MIIVDLIHRKFIHSIRHIGPFNSFDEAYCYAQNIVNNIEKRYKVHKLYYATFQNGLWVANFDTLRYDSYIPEIIQVKEITVPNEFATWYAPEW